MVDLQLNQANNLLLIEALVREKTTTERRNPAKVLQKVDALSF